MSEEAEGGGGRRRDKRQRQRGRRCSDVDDRPFATTTSSPSPPPPSPSRRAIAAVAAARISFLLLLPALLPGHHHHQQQRRQWIDHFAFRSTIEDPAYTFARVREAGAVRRLSFAGCGGGGRGGGGPSPPCTATTGGRFSDAYGYYYLDGGGNSAAGLLPPPPPLVLASAEAAEALFSAVLSPSFSLDDGNNNDDDDGSRRRGQTPPPPHRGAALVLLFVDVVVALYLERIARRLLLLPDGDDDGREDDLQSKMPEKIRPKLAHVFDIWSPASDAQERRQQQRQEGTDGSDTRDSSPPLIRTEDLPSAIALLYLGSPVTALSSSAAYNCYQNVPVLFLLVAIDNALLRKGGGGSAATAEFFAALAAYANVHYVVFAVPVALMIGQREQGTGVFSKSGLALFALFSLCLHGLAFLLVAELHYYGSGLQAALHCAVVLLPIATFIGRGDGRSNSSVKSLKVLALSLFVALSFYLHGRAFVVVGDRSRYGAIVRETHLRSFRLTRMKPSLSTLWYFGMELFDRFRLFFEILLGGIPYLSVIPLTIRLYRYPIVLVRYFALLRMILVGACVYTIWLYVSIVRPL